MITVLPLLAFCAVLVTVGLAGIASYVIDRRASLARAELRAAQVVMSARLAARHGGAQ